MKRYFAKLFFAVLLLTAFNLTFAATRYTVTATNRGRLNITTALRTNFELVYRQS